MKKFILGIILFLFVPIGVYAADYDFTNYSVQAYIQPDGDVKINEIIVLDGEFNGYERELDFAPNLCDNYECSDLYKGSNIEDIEIKAKHISSYSDTLFTDTDYTVFSKAYSASNGDAGKYILTPISNGYKLRMYYKTDNTKTAFLISYTIKDLVVVHKDVAEIYFPFVGDGFSDDIKNVDIKVFLPKSDTSNYFRVWAHGALNGEVKPLSNGLHASVKGIDAGEVVDVRMTFDKNMLTSSYSISPDVYFDKILEIEGKRADDANRLRQELLQKYNFVKYSTIGLYVLIIGLGVFIYYKYGKSPKSGYYSKYNREFIDDYNVEVIDYLMNKKITPNAMSASIMNLIYKKNISVQEIPNEKGKKKDYLFTLENMDNINESEDILIKFLFDKVGKKKSENNEKKQFSTLDLKSYAKGTKTCNTFINSYTKWKNNVLNLGKQEKFYEKSSVPPIIGTIMLFISFFLFIYAISIETDYIPTYLLMFVTFIFFLYTVLVDKKSVRGALHYDKWKAFKNFLNDFGSFELKELPEIVLWERYLVYATVFGLADKVQKDMNVRINEIDVASYDYYPSFVYINIGHDINTSINSAISSAYNRQAANYSNSHSSSSSGGGFGGGFSGGSGFSGGGGGHGF